MLRFIQQLTKLTIISLCVIVGLSYLLTLKPISYLYSQGLPRPAKQEPTNKIGQWVKYEVELSLPASPFPTEGKGSRPPAKADPPAGEAGRRAGRDGAGGPGTTPITHTAGKPSRFLVKRSWLSPQQINNRICSCEEYTILPAHITYQVLREHSTDTVKRIVFQRLGLPTMEINTDKFTELLNKVPAIKHLIHDTTSLHAESLQLISQEKTTRLLPESGKKLKTDWLIYTNDSQTIRLMLWKSKDVPFTGIAKSVFISPRRYVSVTLLDFGSSGARSIITAQPIKFGDKIRPLTITSPHRGED